MPRSALILVACLLAQSTSGRPLPAPPPVTGLSLPPAAYDVRTYVKLSDIQIHFRGGLTLEDVARQPAELVNRFFLDEKTAGPRDPYDVPERETAYPEASMFGLLPAYGFYIRHARGIELDNVEIRLVEPDERPAIVLRDATDVDFVHLEVDRAGRGPVLVLEDVRDFRIALSDPIREAEREFVAREEL